MSFDPSSYSNSDLMTSYHSGQSDMPFNPSSYSNHNLMTSYHAQSNAPFNPTSYNNSNLMTSFIGSYSNMAQVKHVPYDPFESQHNPNALAWDEVREPDELDEPYGGFSSKPKPHKEHINNFHMQPKDTPYKDLSQSKNTHQFKQKQTCATVNREDKTVFHMLSTKDRESIKKIDDPLLTALMNKGDRHAKNGNFKDEMLSHREAQDTLANDYNIKHRSNDLESKKAFGYNSCMIHHPNYTEYYYSLGYKFDDIYKQKGSGGNYKLLKETEYKKDPNAVKYINMSREGDTRTQNYTNNDLKIKSIKRVRKRRHKKNIA